MSRPLFFLAALLGASAAFGQPQIRNTFDTGSEGWTTNCQIQHRTGDGNPGGYLFVDNPEVVPCYLRASDASGLPRSLSGFYGGAISFDGRIFQALDPTWDGRDGQSGGFEGFNYGTITILGQAGSRITIDIVKVPREPAPQSSPWNQWQTHTARLATGVAATVGNEPRRWLWAGPSGLPATEEQMRSVLSFVVAIDINVEAVYGREQEGLDNFTITAPCPAGSRLFEEGGPSQTPPACPPSGRPVPETLTIDAVRASSCLGDALIVGQGVIFINGVGNWTATAGGLNVIRSFRTSGSAPSTIVVQASPAARNGDEEVLTFRFADGSSYQTRVRINVRDETSRLPGVCGAAASGLDKVYLCGPPDLPRIITGGGPDLWRLETRRPGGPGLPAIYEIRGVTLAVPEGTYQGLIVDAQGRALCDVLMPVPPPPPRILLPTYIRFDVYDEDRLPLSQEVPIENPSQTQTMSWRLKFNRNMPPWVRLEQESGAVRPGQSGAIRVIISPDRLPPTPFSEADLYFQAEGFGEVNINVSVSRRAAARPVTVTPASLILTTGVIRTITIRNLNTQQTYGFSAAEPFIGALASDLGLVVTPATGSIPPGGQATLSVRMTNPPASPADGFIRITGSFGEPQTVTVLGARSADPAPRLGTSKGGSPAQGACRPANLLAVFGRPAINFQGRVGEPVPVEVQVGDDCGVPLRRGQVTVQPGNGDAAFHLVSRGDGYWSGAWNPLRESTGFFPLRGQAFSDDGLLFTEFLIPMQVARNPDPPPVVEAASIVSAASLVADRSHAPGEIVSIFGIGLADSQAVASGFPLPTRLGGTSVQVGDLDMALLFASPTQINAVVPFGLRTPSFQEVVIRRGDRLGSATILISGASPGVFTVNQSGRGPGVIVDANFRLIDTNNAARVGDVVIILLAGVGATDPPVAATSPAPAGPLSVARLPVRVTIGGQTAEVLFAGLTPGFAGLYQINTTVPAGVLAGNEVPVVVTAGGLSSPAVTMAVR